MANLIDWYDQIETTVYNKVAKYIEKENGEPVFCTVDEVNVSETEFPTVWIHELEGVERGQDLTNITINAVLYNMQIDIFAKTRAEAKKLMRYAVAEMKALEFNITAMPLVLQNNPDIFHAIARFRRHYGGGDKI